MAEYLELELQLEDLLRKSKGWIVEFPMKNIDVQSKTTARSLRPMAIVFDQNILG